MPQPAAPIRDAARAILRMVRRSTAYTPGRALRRAVLGSALLVAAGAGAQAQTIQIAAPSALLMDQATGAVLFEKDADKRIAPASLEKIMTAAVVFEQIRLGKLTLETPLVVSVNAWRKGGGPSGGAAMFAEVNKPAPVGALLAGALVVSGNDAAITLAEGVAGTEAEFALKMAALARTMGLTNSQFRNATGFPDPDQYTTARDMALLSRAVIRDYPDLYKIFSEPGIDWNKIKQRNRNVLLEAGIGADGLQVGWLKDVGYNLAGSTVQNKQRLIVVVLGAKTEKERLEDAKRLIEWGYHSFEQKLLFNAGDEVGRAQVFGGDTTSVPLVAQGAVTLLSPRQGGERLVARVVYEGPLKAPVAKGAEVAHLEISRGQRKVLDVPLFTGADVGVGTLSQRAMDGALALVSDGVRDIANRAMAKLHK